MRKPKTPKRAELQLCHPPEGMEAPCGQGVVAEDPDCFNWATPRRGWKPPLATTSLGKPDASIGPPPGGDGSNQIVYGEGKIQALQLGHPPEGMEALELRDQIKRPEAASIGPPPRRGWKHERTGSRSVSNPGFNWATPRRGWKLGFMDLFAGRETASIGPPPGVDGSSNGDQAGSGPAGSLQLGHPPEGMEARLALARGGLGASASIGPPPGGDGSRSEGRRSGQACDASIGPPPGGDGSRGRLVRTSLQRAGFNWATPRRGWKPFQCVLRVVGQLASIGPPPGGDGSATRS